jgi:hypothetical protein
MKRAEQKRSRWPANGYPAPRVYHRKAQGKQCARLLIKCGDCDQKFEIYCGPDGEDLEIAGVLAPVKNWRQILLPLLKSPRKPAYRATAKELDRFVKRSDRQIRRERKIKKVKAYSGDLEADLTD